MSRLPGLDALPRRRLATLPTPFEPLPRLGAELGLPLWVKRDDLTGLGLGGNKVRKLELLLGAATADGCDTVVTFGAVQSNHARQTAAACARAGLHCVLVLTRAVARDDEAYLTGGNVLLDRLLGAEVVVVDDTPGAVDAAVAGVRERLDAEGRTARWVPPGGSDAVGTAGYVLAGLELADDAAAAGVELTDVVVATSTGGTQAGLLVGLRAAGCGARVHGVAVYRDAATTAARVAALAGSVADLVGAPAPLADDVLVDDRWMGPGYGLPTPGMVDAVRTAARTEGLLLDPVYSGKAAHALAALTAEGVLGDRAAAGDPGGTGRRAVAFLHTGGAPALFVHGTQLGLH